MWYGRIRLSPNEKATEEVEGNREPEVGATKSWKEGKSVINCCMAEAATTRTNRADAGEGEGGGREGGRNKKSCNGVNRRSDTTRASASASAATANTTLHCSVLCVEDPFLWQECD